MTEERPPEHDPDRDAFRAEVKAWRKDHPRKKKKAGKVKVRIVGGVGGVRFTHRGKVSPR
jgi:hypothetical protein